VPAGGVVILGMCSIVGLHVPLDSPDRRDIGFISAFQSFLARGRERGRDGFGYVASTRWGAVTASKILPGDVDIRTAPASVLVDERDVASASTLIANFRAEPTTEFVSHKTLDDQQPYGAGDWWIVHNGTIANDKELLAECRFSPPGRGVDSWAVAAILHSSGASDGDTCYRAIMRLVGGMALGLLRSRRGEAPDLYLYRNFEPLYLWWLPRYGCYVFSSVAESAQEEFGPEVCEIYVPPYSFVSRLGAGGRVSIRRDEKPNDSRAVVICSGGLDSTTAAKVATMECDDVTIMYFRYGCQAEDREVEAVGKIARSLGCRDVYMDMSWLKALGGCPLLDPEGRISGPEAGAEYAHEWVHARNTAMIGMAAAWCDRYDVGRIYLGLNLEEAGAYQDNTTEFYRLFGRVLDCGTRSRPRILNPCANLTKKEIVELALRIGAPIEHSWSCYRGGPTHCGRCGPCYMRKTAFRMLGRQDMIRYAE